MPGDAELDHSRGEPSPHNRKRGDAEEVDVDCSGLASVDSGNAEDESAAGFFVGSARQIWYPTQCATKRMRGAAESSTIMAEGGGAGGAKMGQGDAGKERHGWEARGREAEAATERQARGGFADSEESAGGGGGARDGCGARETFGGGGGIRRAREEVKREMVEVALQRGGCEGAQAFVRIPPCLYAPAPFHPAPGAGSEAQGQSRGGKEAGDSGECEGGNARACVAQGQHGGENEGGHVGEKVRWGEQTSGEQASGAKACEEMLQRGSERGDEGGRQEMRQGSSASGGGGGARGADGVMSTPPPHKHTPCSPDGPVSCALENPVPCPPRDPVPCAETTVQCTDKVTALPMPMAPESRPEHCSERRSEDGSAVREEQQPQRGSNIPGCPLPRLVAEAERTGGDPAPSRAATAHVNDAGAAAHADPPAPPPNSTPLPRQQEVPRQQQPACDKSAQAEPGNVAGTSEEARDEEATAVPYHVLAARVFAELRDLMLDTHVAHEDLEAVVNEAVMTWHPDVRAMARESVWDAGKATVARVEGKVGISMLALRKKLQASIEDLDKRLENEEEEERNGL
ncbi:unnamed protein product [Closterium sp. Naga37s-1]|nr:unnamed protein product [Closterium sp. Naga37s-1]